MKKIHKINIIITFVFIAFISIFALDVFESGYVWSELLVALFIHLLPSLVLITAYLLTRKNYLARSLVYFGLALFSAYFFKTYTQPISFLIVTTPLLLLSFLAYLEYKNISGVKK